jgi:hypothetical protein
LLWESTTGGPRDSDNRHPLDDIIFGGREGRDVGLRASRSLVG